MYVISHIISLVYNELGIFTLNLPYAFYQHDTSSEWQIFLQDYSTPSMWYLVQLHHILLFYLVTIGVAVFWFISSIILNYIDEKSKNWSFKISFESSIWKPLFAILGGFMLLPTYIKKNVFSHDDLKKLEIIWTTVPSIVLTMIAVPSFTLLYFMETLNWSDEVVKIIGHQWYWTYEINDTEFDSFLKDSSDLNNGEGRLLEVDLPLILQLNKRVKFLVTSTDVIHSWSVPSLGIKVDGVPGRLNQITTTLNRKGRFFGQCSEICGVQHGFMPIEVRVISL